MLNCKREIMKQKVLNTAVDCYGEETPIEAEELETYRKVSYMQRKIIPKNSLPSFYIYINGTQYSINECNGFEKKEQT